MLQFAAVLNEKKAKAIEWKQKAEQAQESVQKASNEVSSSVVQLLPIFLASTGPFHSSHVQFPNPINFQQVVEVQSAQVFDSTA